MDVGRDGGGCLARVILLPMTRVHYTGQLPFFLCRYFQCLVIGQVLGLELWDRLLVCVLRAPFPVTRDRIQNLWRFHSSRFDTFRS